VEVWDGIASEGPRPPKVPECGHLIPWLGVYKCFTVIREFQNSQNFHQLLCNEQICPQG